MATRCQVLVVSEPKGTPGRDHGSILAALYHHWDGYPGNMLRLFQEARERIEMHADTQAKEVLAAQREVYAKREAAGFQGAALAPSGCTPETHAEDARRLARSRAIHNVASWVVAQEPDGYEIEQSVTVTHGDVEYIYRLACARVDAEPDKFGGTWNWFVRVDKITFGDDREEQLSRRAGLIALDWSQIDSPAVDAIIEAHEKHIADYLARNAVPA